MSKDEGGESLALDGTIHIVGNDDEATYKHHAGYLFYGRRMNPLNIIEASTGISNETLDGNFLDMEITDLLIHGNFSEPTFAFGSSIIFSKSELRNPYRGFYNPERVLKFLGCLKSNGVGDIVKISDKGMPTVLQIPIGNDAAIQIDLGFPDSTTYLLAQQRALPPQTQDRDWKDLLETPITYNPEIKLLLVPTFRRKPLRFSLHDASLFTTAMSKYAIFYGFILESLYKERGIPVPNISFGLSVNNNWRELHDLELFIKYYVEKQPRPKDDDELLNAINTSFANNSKILAMGKNDI